MCFSVLSGSLSASLLRSYDIASFDITRPMKKVPGSQFPIRIISVSLNLQQVHVAFRLRLSITQVQARWDFGIPVPSSPRVRIQQARPVTLCHAEIYKGQYGTGSAVYVRIRC